MAYRPLGSICERFSEGADPDVAEAQEGVLDVGVEVVLEEDRAVVAGALFLAAGGVAFDIHVVLDEDAVVEEGEGGGLGDFAVGAAAGGAGTAEAGGADVAA